MRKAPIWLPLYRYAFTSDFQSQKARHALMRDYAFKFISTAKDRPIN